MEGCFKPLWAFERYPGYLFYPLTGRGVRGVETKVVMGGVTTGFAFRVSFAGGKGRPGGIFRDLWRQDGTDWLSYEGFSVWVKGDGSGAKGVVALGRGQGARASFPLKTRVWRRIDLRWSDFTPRPPVEITGQDIHVLKIDSLTFTLSADWKRPASYIIDRPGFVKDFDELDACDRRARVGKRKSTTRLRERDADLGRFAARGERLIKTRTKLAKRDPLTILAWGDSITAGGELLSGASRARPAFVAYVSLFAEKLKRKFGDGGIRVLRSASGGYSTDQAEPNIRRDVLDRHPDLVILALGTSDSRWSTLGRFKEHWTKIIERLLAEKIEVICWVMTPIAFKVARGEPFAEYVREYAKRHNLPLADVHACFLARGDRALGELLPDDAHPLPAGNEMLAEVLFALFRSA